MQPPKKRFLQQHNGAEQLCTWWDAFLVLDLSLDILDGVGWLHLEGDGLASEGLDENLHDDLYRA